MLVDQLLTSWLQRCSIAALAKIGSDGVIVSIIPVSWSMDMTTLMKEFTAVLVRETVLGFCRQTSKERRKDSAANTWFGSVGLYFAHCWPPMSFALATRIISRSSSAYAYQRD